MKDIAIEIKTNSMDRLNDRLDAFEREFYELEKYMFKITSKAIRKTQKVENKKEKLRDMEYRMKIPNTSS